jgi:hypothetical protein
VWLFMNCNVSSSQMEVLWLTDYVLVHGVAVHIEKHE